MAQVWVVISASPSQQRLVELIDKGYLSEAVGISQALEGFIAKLKSHVQQHGGHMPIALYERVVMQLSMPAAEELPSILEGYQESLGKKVAAGIGMTFEEAAKAATKSLHSGDIELYNPEEVEEYEEFAMTEPDQRRDSRRFEDGIVLPPNLFDPTVPDDEEYKLTQDGAPKPKLSPNYAEAMQAEAKYIQDVANQLGAQEAQQQMQQAVQQQQQPQDLLEALNGGQVEGHTPKTDEDEEGGKSKGGSKKVPKSSKEGSKDDDKEDGEDDSEEVEEEVTDAETAAKKFDEKLAGTLHNIKSQIPQIMALADSNPQAFKQTMDLINKLVNAAHKREKAGDPNKKSEARLELEELAKQFQHRAGAHPKGVHHQILPVGSRKGKYKKVMANGKAVWKEMSAGAVKDDQGNAISVRVSNEQAKGK